MRRLALATCTTLASCNAPEFAIFEDQQAKFASEGSDSSEAPGTTADDAATSADAENMTGSASAGVSATDAEHTTGAPSDG